MSADHAKGPARPRKSLAAELEDPCFFLVDFDFEERSAVFARGRPEWFMEKLRLSAYDLPLDSLVALPIKPVLDALPGPPANAGINYLFHLPFCGSTFLTRHLEDEAVWLLRDPASLDAVFRKQPGRDYPAFIDELRHMALTCLNRRLAGRSTVVRTAGYYPGMLEALIHSATFRSGALLYSAPEYYLVQVLKSAERRRHVRLLMSCEQPFVVKKTRQTLDTLADTSVAALFWIHFVETVLRVASDRVRTLDCVELFANPEGAVSRVATMFDITSLRTSEKTQKLRLTHAKTGEIFDPDRRVNALELAGVAHHSELLAARDILQAANATAMLAELRAMSI